MRHLFPPWSFSVYYVISLCLCLSVCLSLPFSLSLSFIHMHTVKFIISFSSQALLCPQDPQLHMCTQTHPSPAPLTGNAFLLFPASSVAPLITVICPGKKKKKQNYRLLKHYLYAFFAHLCIMPKMTSYSHIKYMLSTSLYTCSLCMEEFLNSL